MVILHPPRQPLHRSPGRSIGTITLWQPASGGLSFFSTSASKYHTKIKPEGRNSLCGKISLPNVESSQRQKKKQAHFQTQIHTHIHTFWHLGFVCILLLEAIISLTGKKYCCLFVVYFCAFPPLDCPLVLLHLCARTLTNKYTHQHTCSHTDSRWPGQPPITLSHPV